ncbi:hypothetical protein VNO80_24859 [Phaseolus coccineus]|uniref:Uncharacterized protein n=1 Tax=Phaseolus coccineus TaxID=3886 RepID=A0AAN9LYD4_PHACN
MARARNLMVAGGLVAFAAAGMSFPFYMASSKKPVIDPTKPLSPQATFRGPYINTGSRDVGPDVVWWIVILKHNLGTEKVWEWNFLSGRIHAILFCLKPKEQKKKTFEACTTQKPLSSIRLLTHLA